MALHLLKQGQYAPSWGKVLGSALGEGLSAVAQNKLTRMKENEDIKLFTTLGIDPIRARLIHRLPSGQKEEAIASILRDNEEEKANRAQYDSQGASPVSEALGGQQQEPQQAQERPGLSNLFSQQKQPLNSPVAPMLLPKELREALEQDQQQAFPQGRQEQQAQQSLQQQPQEEQPRPEYKPLRSENEILARALSKGTMTQAQKTSKQSSINRQNAPFNKMLDKAQVNAEVAVDAADNIIRLVETGQVASGFSGKWPLWTQNEETQEFAKYSKILAQQISGQSGVSGAYKIKFAEGQKPNLEDSTQTQLNSAKHLKKEAERVLKKVSIRDEIIEENGGEEPASLSSLVNDRLKGLEKGNDTFSELPNPKEWFSLHGRKPIVNEETGEEAVSNGKEWTKV